MRIILLLSFLLVSAEVLQAQEKNIWSTLAMMKYERQYAESDGIGGMAGGNGRFRPLVEALDGKEVEVKGYIIPLSGKKAQSHFMFSAYPYNMCFFCGQAGPESVMEVIMESNAKVEYSDDPIVLKGIFHFRPTAGEDIMYHLEHALKVK
ncbi:MAG: DUF3299 domain-containing protein [Bacteroidota bacterium]